MALRTELTMRLAAIQSGSQDFGGPDFKPLVNLFQVLADGGGVGQADMLYADERQVALSGTDDIDLAGVLVGALGNTLTFVRIVSLLIINAPKSPTAPRNSSRLTIGLGSAPFLGFLQGTTPAIKNIGPGGAMFLHAPDATGLGTVTATSADILRVANSSEAGATYQIGILGRST